MDIDEFLKAKVQMEAKILVAVVSAVDEFKTKTGFSPDSLSIDLIDATNIGMRRRRHIVGSVRARVPLE